MKKRILAFLLCAVMVLLLPATGAAAVDLGEWQTSKSKTATQLDSAFESKVTLSLPSAEEQLVTDIVFVLDKSTSAKIEEEALSMLSELKTQVSATGSKVKVGVVIFNKVANVTGFMDLATEYEAIEEAITQEIKSGTNMHAGLLAGKELLEGDTAVPANRKYLVLVSDGLSYYFCKNGNYETGYTIASLNGGDDGNGNRNCKPIAGIDCWEIKYGSLNYTPDNWSDWFNGAAEVLKNDYSAYEYEVGSADIPTENDSEGAISYAEKANYPINADISLYSSYNLYRELSGKYNCYAVNNGGAAYPWGDSFMELLSGGKDVSFSNIQNDILYLLDAGSYVVDVIGNGTDNHGNPYDFKFVPEASKLTLTVGDQTYKTDVAPVGGETARFLFTPKGVGDEDQAEAHFELCYYENGIGDNSEEHFVWYIYVPVSKFAPVQLTYTVVLTNPQKTEGTYGEYDGNGSRNLGSLYTNNEAILYPVASDGTEGRAEDFPKPTVSYTVGKAPVKDEEGKNDYKDTVTIEIKGDKKEEKNPDTGAPSSLVFVGAAAALKGIF
ncbi:MAG: vWA domain-containing protein [Oscillospiraceae bacterium]